MAGKLGGISVEDSAELGGEEFRCVSRNPWSRVIRVERFASDAHTIV